MRSTLHTAAPRVHLYGRDEQSQRQTPHRRARRHMAPEHRDIPSPACGANLIRPPKTPSAMPYHYHQSHISDTTPARIPHAVLSAPDSPAPFGFVSVPRHCSQGLGPTSLPSHSHPARCCSCLTRYSACSEPALLLCPISPNLHADQELHISCIPTSPAYAAAPLRRH